LVFIIYRPSQNNTEDLLNGKGCVFNDQAALAKNLWKGGRDFV